MRAKRKWARRLVVLILCLVLGPVGYISYSVLTGNVHRLPDGQIYRSGQPGPRTLEHLARAHSIRSVLNLRGPNPGQTWYQSETNLSATLGLRHIDLPLSAKRQLTEPEMDRLVALMRDLPKPLLIHCASGADRTSLACALYRYDIAGETADAAVRELSFRYGHFPYLKWRESVAMDHSFWSHTTNHFSDKPLSRLPGQNPS